MNEITNILSPILRSALESMLPEIIDDIRKEERMRIHREEDPMAHPLYTKKDMAKHFITSVRSIEKWTILLPPDLQPIQIMGNVRYSDAHVKFFESLHK